MRGLLLLMLVLLSPAVAVAQEITPRATPALAAPVVGYRIIAPHPHDRRAFTQGLAYADGVLYQGTGLEGKSMLRGRTGDGSGTALGCP